MLGRLFSGVNGKVRVKLCHQEFRFLFFTVNGDSFVYAVYQSSSFLALFSQTTSLLRGFLHLCRCCCNILHNDCSNYYAKFKILSLNAKRKRIGDFILHISISLVFYKILFRSHWIYLYFFCLFSFFFNKIPLFYSI